MRRSRAANIAVLGLEAALFFCNLCFGHVLTSVIPAVCFLLVGLTIVWQTRKIRTIEMPAPDYGQIARMEREIYGKTFTREREGK